MDYIGGFFELEVHQNDGHLYHNEAIALSTGRACLRYILESASFSKVYLPFYCCDATIEPLKVLNIPYEFYALNESFEIDQEITLKEDELLIYCNFFGIKSEYTEQLAKAYKDKLLVDDTHSFFTKGYQLSDSFTSARKYFGVPDGAFLYSRKSIDRDIERNNKISLQHNTKRLIGLQDEAYQDYVKYEKTLGSDLSGISLVSEFLLKGVNYQLVRDKRNENFKLLHAELENLNELSIPETEFNDCFCYPLLMETPIDRQDFFERNIFIPWYWKDTVNRNIPGFHLEKKWSIDILPLPIDHRYGEEEMRKMVDVILSTIEKT